MDNNTLFVEASGLSVDVLVVDTGKLNVYIDDFIGSMVDIGNKNQDSK